MSKLLRRALPFVVLTALNVGFHLPTLVNADGVHSDAAIVGLQAMHTLDGEISRFLWGAGYQGSFDVLVIAALFALGGPSTLKLMLGPFLGHLVLSFFAWHLLARRLSPWKAFLLCLPLVVTPQAINAVALYAPRQWSITVLFAGIWILDGAGRGRWTVARLALGLFVASLSLFLDLYALQIFVPLCVFALFCAADPPWSRRSLVLRVVGVAAGLALGLLAVKWLRSAEGASSGAASLVLTAAQLRKNWPLFIETCFPMLLAAKVYVGGAGLYPDRWVPPLLIGWMQIAGAGTMVLGTAAAPFLGLSRRILWPVRRLGLLGAGAACATILGFLLSWMPSDMWATRYLAPFLWLAPFSLAPLASLLRSGVVAALLAPYVVSAALGGWLTLGGTLDGGIPRFHDYDLARRERAVAALLRARGVKSAAAQYWLAYRMSFLFEENPEVTPIERGDGRYPPYDRRFDAAPVVAYIFSASDPRATPEQIEPRLQAEGGKIERHELEGFVVIVHERAR